MSEAQWEAFQRDVDMLGFDSFRSLETAQKLI